MARVLMTGMSGVGKSTALAVLEARGHRVVNTDSDEWSEWVTGADGERDWIWREDAVRDLLQGHHDGHLFVSGCKTNQGRLYPYFDQVVLLSAPTPVMLERVAARDSNGYGKSEAERAEILRNLEEFEPRIRATATAEIDTTVPLEQVVDRLEALAAQGSSTDAIT